MPNIMFVERKPRVILPWLIIAVVLLAGGYAVAQGFILTRNVAEASEPQQGIGTAISTNAPEWSVEVYEDGSGHVLQNGAKIAQVDSEFFPWDCETNGNGGCGPDAPDEVRGYKCVQWVMGAYNTTLHWCTSGDLDWWTATDQDAEGEVIG